MNNTKEEKQNLPVFLYNYVCDEKEIDLARLEMNALFGVNLACQYHTIETTINIDPSRSPFISSKIDIQAEGSSVEEIFELVQTKVSPTATFKVVFVKNQAEKENFSFERRRWIEREIGIRIKGMADLKNPEMVYAIMYANKKWIFGKYEETKNIWLHHKAKPHSYSTSLNTRLARAIVNIAIPNPEGIKAIDPCCGIGTVVVEALSMGIAIKGSDNNPLVMEGARENIAHFGYQSDIRLMDICDHADQYDVAIVDLPYNLCSVLPEEAKQSILRCARSLAKKVVFITVEPITSHLKAAGFEIIEQCEVKKRTFTRQILVCH